MADDAAANRRPKVDDRRRKGSSAARKGSARGNGDRTSKKGASGVAESKKSSRRGTGASEKGKGKGKSKGKGKQRVEDEVIERPLGRARAFADVNSAFPKSRFDIEGYKLKWGNFKKYSVEDMVGQGAYGEVFLATNTQTDEQIVVKTIRPEKEEKIKIQREILMLSLVQGGPNIVELKDLVKDPKTKLKMIVFEYIENPDFHVVFGHFDDAEARNYLFQILKALEFTHSQGIIHRDLKPRNLLYNPRTRELRLIDWGFAEFYWPGRAIQKWPGTRYYKSPDLFLHYEHYDYSVDMWAFGCILGAVVFRRIPMFRGYDDSMSQMQAIAKTLGSDDMHRYITKYRMPLRAKYREGIKRRKRTPWSAYVYNKNRHLAVPEAIDLVDKILVWDHEKRLTCTEALAHPYFADCVAADTNLSTSTDNSTNSETDSDEDDEDDGVEDDEESTAEESSTEDSSATS